MTEGIKKAIDYIKANDSYVENAITLQGKAWRGEKSAMPVLALACGLTEEQSSWLPWSNYKDIHFDSEKMLINGLRDVLSAVNGSYGAVPSMRANMGCGIIASLFGTQQRLFDDKMPWLLDHPSKADIQKIYSENCFKVSDSLEFAAAMDHMDYMYGVLKDKGLNNIYIYPLDLQGSIDTAHLIYGDTIFYDFYDDPEFVNGLLNSSNIAIDFAMRECFKRISRVDEFVPHYNHLAIPRDVGAIKISEDTTTLLSAEHIAEYAQPYLRDLLERFGGGYVHYCGRNDHLLDMILKEPLVIGINFGNTDMHDMTEILTRCRENKKPYVGGICRIGDESNFDYFKRILEPSYDKENDYFYVLLQYGCGLNDRANIIGEFERAVEWVKNKKYE